jgi:hypothetical protein
LNNKHLIESAFPLKQASLDSVHEKNVRHGHISTLHIWPARRHACGVPRCACHKHPHGAPGEKKPGTAIHGPGPKRFGDPEGGG